VKKVLLIGGQGYIGSTLYVYLRNKYEIDIVDLGWFGTPHRKFIRQDYENLPREFVRQYDVVILLAGYSSVAMCSDMKATMDNNVNKFISLINKLSPDQLFLYASSASVYGFSGEKASKETDPFYPPINYYDASKQMIDNLISLTNLNYKGLRFGTVCGYSPNLRLDVIINSMVYSYVRGGTIRVNNRASNRAILDIQDLCREVGYFIENIEAPRGVYNMCSFNASIGYIAQKVSDYLGARLEFLPDNHTYSFQLAFNNPFNMWYSTIDNIIEQFEKVDFKCYHKKENNYKRLRPPA
jgi:nucleoside-diphosphate-sugar epimerase